MLPVKGHNGNNPCWTPANKDPKLPKDTSNPSLLKALDAVVAAGRRGLLGPEGVAAAAAVPEQKRHSSNGTVSQQHQIPVPRVKKRKKPRIKKHRALLTVVQSATAAGRCDLLGPEGVAAVAAIPEQKRHSSNGTAAMEQQRQIPVPCVKKRKKPRIEKHRALLTVVQSTTDSECLQPTPKEIWICGNSVIMASKKRAQSHPDGLQLGISTSRAYVYWHGIQAMMWQQLIPLLHEIYHLRSPPSIIIIHVGEDDLMPDNVSLIISMKNDLAILKRAFPNTIIVWSSLLPRRFWKKGQEPVHMDGMQRLVNKKMVDYCNEIGTHFLSHNLIISDKKELFLPDVNDLSNEGADVFIADLKKVLRFYQMFG